MIGEFSINDSLISYTSSWPFSIGAAIITVLIFLFSKYGKKLKLKIEGNDLNLKDRDTGHALILHMGELSLLILLFEKIESSTVI